MSSCLDPLRRFKKEALARKRELVEYHVPRTMHGLSARLRGTHAQGIDWAVISADLNPRYAFFLPLTTLFWNEICNARTLIVAVGTAQEWQADPFGRLVLQTVRDWRLRCEFLHVPKSDLLSPGNLAQVMRIWGLTQAADGFCITSDADLLPLRKTYFSYPRDTRKSDLYLWNADHYSPNLRYTMGYIGASADIWREIVGLRTQDEAVAFFRREYERLSPGFDGSLPASSGNGVWWNDEAILTELIANWCGYPERCAFIRSAFYTFRRRLHWNRMGAWEGFHPRQASWYVDAHLIRDTWEEWQYVEPLVKACVPAVLHDVASYVKRWSELHG